MSENMVILDSEVGLVLILGKRPVEIVILGCAHFKICGVWGNGSKVVGAGIEIN